MEYKRTPGEGTTEDFGEGLDRDYILAMSGMMPETAVGELPIWAWVVCMATLAVLTIVILNLS